MRFEELGFAPDTVDYLTAWEHQKLVHAAVVAGELEDTTLLLEHTAVYTAGKRTEPHERPMDGTPVIDVDRGGRITWHGPGQLVGYPIVKLPDHVLVVDYVRRLEEALIMADCGARATAPSTSAAAGTVPVDPAAITGWVGGVRSQASANRRSRVVRASFRRVSLGAASSALSSAASIFCRSPSIHCSKSPCRTDAVISTSPPWKSRSV